MANTAHRLVKPIGVDGTAELPQLPFEHIACFVDDSDTATHVLAEAQRLRSLSRGSLTIVHIALAPLLFDAHGQVSPMDIWSEARDRHAERVAAVPGAAGALLAGHPPSVACQWARTAHVDLMVAAPHHTPRERRVFGSFTSYLTRHAPTSVLLVRGLDEGPLSTPYRHIACCVDRSDASLQALDLARRLRAAGPGTLTVLTAAFVPPRPDTNYKDVADVEVVAEGAASWLRRETSSMPDVDVAVATGYPPPAACEEWAVNNGCDLMVASAHRGFIDRIVLGSFADHLAHHAPCSVLLRRPPASHSGRTALRDEALTPGHRAEVPSTKSAVRAFPQD